MPARDRLTASMAASDIDVVIATVETTARFVRLLSFESNFAKNQRFE
jgi:hypothetical protein